MTSSATPRRHELALSSEVLFRSFSGHVERTIEVNGLVCADRTDAMLRVVEHELVHLMLTCDALAPSARGEGHHGRSFQRLARAVFGHSHWTHDMVTPREEAATKHGVKQGSTVEFTFHGEVHKGVVDRITKRATVLVRCAAERSGAKKFNDGSHYLTFFVPPSQCKVVG